MKLEYFTDDGEQRRYTNLEDQYRESGLTISLLQKRLRGLKEILDEGGYFEDHRMSFYADTSDPIKEVRETVDVRDKVVTTVAGGGDFLQLFADMNAKEVHVFDMSPYAILWNELKATALKTLNYNDYKRMFNTRMNESIWKRPVFNTDIYITIRGRLTEQARYFFDALTSEKLKKIFQADIYPNSNDFVRTRGRSFIPDIIDTEEKYQALQAKMEKIKWTAKLTTIQDMLKKDEDFSEFLYLSNIGYNPEISIDIAKDAISCGVEHVVCCWYDEDVKDVLDKYPLEVGTLLKTGYRSAVSKILADGGSPLHGDIVNYGIVVDIAAEDNPSWTNPFVRNKREAA
jgi:hypothetical protein